MPTIRWVEDLAGEIQALLTAAPPGALSRRGSTTSVPAIVAAASAPPAPSGNTLQVPSSSTATLPQYQPATEIILLPGIWHSLRRVEGHVHASQRWLVALLKLPAYLLAISRDGTVAALSPGDRRPLWTANIEIEGPPFTFVWHAVYDERRRRVLFCYHYAANILLAFGTNLRPVPIYWADLAALEAASVSKQRVKTNLLFKRDDWSCLGMAIDPASDLLFCTDWMRHKVGVFKVANLEANSNAEPEYVITLADKSKKFHPTRCALLKLNSNSSSTSLTLAVSDWRNSKIHLFNVAIATSPDGSLAGIESKYDGELAKYGTKSGQVYGPVDLQFDNGTGNLVVCDQRNGRLQLLVVGANTSLTKPQRIICEKVGSYFSATAVIDCDDMPGETPGKFIAVGLNSGEVHYYRIMSDSSGSTSVRL